MYSVSAGTRPGEQQVEKFWERRLTDAEQSESTKCLKINTSSSNKFAQSKLGKGPRRGTVAHVRRKVPIGYNGAPQIRPQKYHFPWTDPKTPLPASSLHRPTYDAKRHLDPIRRFSTMRWTDRRTYGPTHRATDHPRKSLINIGRCATRATRHSNNNIIR